MANEHNAVAGFPRWTADADFTAGSEVSDYPADNLGTLPLSYPWRSTGVSLDETTITATFAKPRKVGLVVLGPHNLSIGSRLRVSLYESAADVALIEPEVSGLGAATVSLPSYVTFSRASSGTYFDAAGAMQTAASGVARFDHDPVTGAAKGLLIEEARTNSIRNSACQGAVVGVVGSGGALPTHWSVFAANGLATSVAGIGTEDGAPYVDLRLAGTATSTFYVLSFDSGSAAASAGQAWTGSVYLRRVAGSTANITRISNRLGVGGSGAGTVDANPLTIGADRLARFADTATAGAGATSVNYGLVLTFATGASIDITLRIGLPQLELGAFATSPIITTGAPVTRAADVCSLPLSSVPGWNPNEATMVAEADLASTSAAVGRVIWHIDDGNANNRIYLVRNSLSGKADANVLLGGVGQATLSSADPWGDGVIRHAMAWRANDFAAAFNGGAVVTDTSGGVPTVTTLRLVSTGGSYPNGHIRRLRLFNRRLSNAELQAVTSGTVIAAGLILDLDFTKVNPTPVSAPNGTYDVLVTGEVAGVETKRWASLTVSGGTGTIQPLTTEARIASYAAFATGLTERQKANYLATGSTRRPIQITDWLETWPAVFTEDQVDWDGGRWWDRTYTPEEIQGYPWYRPILLDEGMYAAAVLVEIDDQLNDDGFVQVGLCELAEALRFPLNFEVGANYGYRGRTETQEADGGTKYRRRRPKPRVMKCSVPYCPRDSALGSYLEMQRQLDTAEPFFWWPNPTDDRHMVRNAYMAHFTELDLYSYATHDRDGVQISIEEEL